MAKKRANGEGNIKKRENGTWEARFSVNGKRHSIYGKTRAEVRKKLTDTLAKIDQEQFIEKTDMTVGEWLTIWQRDYIGNVKRGTAVNYELHLRLYILPVLSEVKLSDLKTPMIQRVYNSLINEKGLSPKTVKNAHGCLHKALSVAVKIGYIAKNPSEACILPLRGLRKSADLCEEAALSAPGDRKEFPIRYPEKRKAQDAGSRALRDGDPARTQKAAGAAEEGSRRSVG